MVTGEEQTRPSASLWLGRLALVLGGAAVGALLLFAAMLLFVPPGTSAKRADTIEDINNVKQMVAEILSASRIRETADGRIDVYKTVFGILELVEDNAALLRNNRADRGPTIAEIRAGEYRNFVWERALAGGVRGATEKVPMLWDPRPIDGKRVVGFSDGRVKVLTEEEFQGLRR